MGYTDAHLQLSKARSTPESVTHGLIPHVLKNVSNLCVFPINVISRLECLLFASTYAFSLD